VNILYELLKTRKFSFKVEEKDSFVVFFISRGLKVHFFDSEVGDAGTLIFIHGNSHSGKTFVPQLRSPALSAYRCIALDLPGHGDSEAAEAYSLELFVSVVSDLVTHLGLRSFALVGHSLGGHVVLQALSALDPRGVFVFGAPPLSIPLDMSGFRSRPELAALFKNEVSDTEAVALLGTMYRARAVTAEDVAEFRKTDRRFRESLAGSFGEGRFRDEALLLAAYSGEATLLALEDDELVDAGYIRRRFPALAVSVPGPHNLHVEAPEAFNELLLNFCHATFGKQGPVTDEQRSGENFPRLEGHAAAPGAYAEGAR
jgi:pimeloyl-ACP methyl ester carboxylesterase